MNHARDPLYRRDRFPAEVIGYAVWQYFRFPLRALLQTLAWGRGSAKIDTMEGGGGDGRDQD